MATSINSILNSGVNTETNTNEIKSPDGGSTSISSGTTEIKVEQSKTTITSDLEVNGSVKSGSTDLGSEINLLKSNKADKVINGEDLVINNTGAGTGLEFNNTLSPVNKRKFLISPRSDGSLQVISENDAGSTVSTWKLVHTGETELPASVTTGGNVQVSGSVFATGRVQVTGDGESIRLKANNNSNPHYISSQNTGDTYEAMISFNRANSNDGRIEFKSGSDPDINNLDLIFAVDKNLVTFFKDAYVTQDFKMTYNKSAQSNNGAKNMIFGRYIGIHFSGINVFEEWTGSANVQYPILSAYVNGAAVDVAFFKGDSILLEQDTTAKKAFTVQGNTVAQGTLAVTGASTLNGVSTINGNATLNGNATFNGDSTFKNPTYFDDEAIANGTVLAKNGVFIDRRTPTATELSANFIAKYWKFNEVDFDRDNSTSITIPVVNTSGNAGTFAPGNWFRIKNTGATSSLLALTFSNPWRLNGATHGALINTILNIASGKYLMISAKQSTQEGIYWVVNEIY